MIRTIFVLLLATSPAHAAGTEDGPTLPTPVIVELFTSEGCSSCPMADSMLGSLQMSQPIHGVEIVGLSQHVDYWDGQGWKDPYSSAQFTERQRYYTRKFANNTPYTPQIVIGGHEEFVGNDRRKAIRAIVRAAEDPRANISVLPLPDAEGDSLKLAVRITELPKGISEAFVMLALTEGKLSSKVEAGENVGLKLRHESVVRELRVIGELESSATEVNPIETEVALASDWKRKNLRAVVFIQERKSLRIRGAGLARLGETPVVATD